MAEKPHRPTHRLVRLGWLFAVLLAATTLIWVAKPATTLHDSAIQNPTPSVTKSTPIVENTSLNTLLSKSKPVKILIPSIGVNSNIMKLGLAKDGTLEVPPDGSKAGWFTGGPTPGEIGPSVVVGHVDWKGKLGVFFYLRKVVIGSAVNIVRADGTTAHFKVIGIQSFNKNNFPTQLIYGNINYAGLRLITCGDFDFKLHKYVSDLVVFAKAV
jgi:hypothetical protein